MYLRTAGWLHDVDLLINKFEEKHRGIGVIFALYFFCLTLSIAFE